MNNEPQITPEQIREIVRQELEPIKRALEEYRQSQNSVNARQDNAIIADERTLSNFIVVSTYSRTSSHELPPHSQKTLAALATAASQKIAESTDPLPVAIEFYNKCMGYLRQSGVRIIDL
jgi:hypothetical protein